MNHFKRIFLSFFILFLFQGCDNEVEDVPGYVYLEEFTFSTDYPTQGFPSSDIRDAWVFVDDNFIGAYTLPALVPIPTLGEVDLDVYPGVKENGGSQNRQIYSMYKKHSKKMTVKEAVVDTIRPTTEYKNNVKMVWLEDFEDQALSTIPSINNQSKDTIQIIAAPNPVTNNEYHGYIDMGTSDSFELFEHISLNQWNVPNGDNDVYLELDYKTNVEVQFGIYADKVNLFEQIGVLVVFPTTEWTKIYINLKSETGVLANSDKINIFFGAFNNGDDSSKRPQIYLDNIKLVHLN